MEKQLLQYMYDIHTSLLYIGGAFVPLIHPAIVKMKVLRISNRTEAV